MKLKWIVSIVFITLFVVNADIKKGESLKLFSTSFEHQNPLPKKYTCDGSGIVPELSWSNFPKNTKSFVLIVDDPDAVGGVWDHWVVYNIPSNINTIPEGGVLPEKAKIGKSTNGQFKYIAPCPPKGSGEHRYTFKLYALSVEKISPDGDSKQDIQKAMKDYILDEATLIGTYKRKKFLFF